jgi:ABC-2 type transport system ATP-binding protein
VKVEAGVAEIKLRDEAGAQQILADALSHGTLITRFEVLEPTIEEIFIETVGGQADA